MSFDAYQSEDRAVCADCFSDAGIKRFIEREATEEECSFCGVTADEPIAVPIGEVVEFIEQGIGGEYGNPDECGMTWDKEDQRYYPGKTYDTSDLVSELVDLPNDDGTLSDAICAGFQNDLWCDTDQYRLSEHEQLRYSWQYFCHIIKHQRRYFFSNYGRRDEDDEIFSPERLLKIMFEYAETIGLIRKLHRGTRLYRVRKLSGSGRTALDLGPPPAKKACQPNRMSPAGISMLYTSEDPETALRETADAPGTYTVATFATERDATVIDFSQLPDIPTLFEEIPDSMEYNPRKLLIFLHTLSRDFSRPIVRDDRVHIEYVPTQVVTEYMRAMKALESESIDGVRYSSARHASGASIVLFCDPHNLILPEDERTQHYDFYKDRWIRLISHEDRVISVQDIDTWKTTEPSHSDDEDEWSMFDEPD